MSIEYKGPYYVVAVGARPDIYSSYKEAFRYLDGYPKACIKKYETLAKAKAAFRKRSRSDYDPSKEFAWSYSRPVRRR